MKANQGVGREAIQAELRVEELRQVAPFRLVGTQAPTREAHLNSPNLGAHLAAESQALLQAENKQVQVVVSDGLSAEGEGRRSRCLRSAQI